MDSSLDGLSLNCTRITTAQAMLGLIASMWRPDASVALALFGLFGVLLRKKEVLSFYFPFLVFSVILDLWWCFVSPSTDGFTQKLAFFSAVVNMILKFVSVPFIHRFNQELPDAGGFSFVGGLGIAGQLPNVNNPFSRQPFAASSAPYQAL
eukprot:tig00001056_g6626.t1